MKSTTVYIVCTLLLIIDGTDGGPIGDGSAGKAVDGNKERAPEICQCCASTAHTANTWFRLDLGKDFIIQHLEILGREEPPGLYQSFQNMTLSLIEENSAITSQETIQDRVYVVNRSLSSTVVARYVNMQIPQKGHFVLCEISVYGDCVDGRFGDDCDTICHCKEGPCNKTIGICPAGGCKRGYFGETCSTGCLDGKFGEDCTEFCGNCSNNDPCDKKTGNCTSCAPGYENDLICKTECQDGKYGQACGLNCSGNCLGGVPCNKASGNCDLCAAGFIGSKCDVECPDGYFGLNCTRRCYCKEGVCNKITGTCPGLCAPGYVGPACESECLHGSYGQNCSSICGKCANNVTCNHIDGTCTECAPGYLTVFCNQTCPPGNFGLDCLEECGECRDESYCRFTNGVCLNGCDRGYRDSTCKQVCDDGTFGYNCDTACGSCKDDVICNKTHGTCMLGCKAGYKPDICLEECDDKTFGENCAFLCGTCLNNSPCNKTTGLCDEGCGAGYNGTFCNNSCVDGRYGDDCNTICHCKNGPCNKTTGICPAGGCKIGYFGETCSTECKNRTYGENCTAYCGNCLNNAPCDTKTGHCNECGPGYVGAFCKQECEDGYYGFGCGDICDNCLNGVACNKVDGHCQLCPPGLHGSYCDEGCPDGYFGLNCSGRCHCNGGSCNTVTGECPGSCAPGFAGRTCNSVCAHGTFGQNCTAECGLCADNMTCHHEDGTCNGCISGYLTDFCNLTCPSGMYGLNCAKRCSEHCYDDTICDFRTGDCDLGCDPGYTSKDCNTECDENHYGRNCEESCGSCSNGTCDKKDGHCMACLDGFTLPLCKKDDKSNTKIWPIIGGVIGAVIGIATICIFIFVYIKRRRNNQTKRNSSDILNNGQRTKIDYNAEDSTEDMIKIDKEDPVKYRTEMQNEIVKQTGMYMNVSFTDAAKQNAKVQISDSISAGLSGLKICMLWNYIADMKRNNCKKFYQEFELLQAGPLHPHKMALQYPSQNCYRGIYAYDHNRVPLTVDKPDESEYINASFIDGFEKEKKFIACQGPSRETAKQFWQMIWQYNCKQILILTNLVETGTDKYAKYWAEEHEVTFGSITIKPGTFERMKDYDIRTFRISKNGKPAQSVTQYHFKAWQDKDVPDSPWSLVSFWLRVTKDMVVKADVGPVVVHCSAGVGRTGLFIALDFLYNQGKTDGRLTPFQAVAALRDQRPFMVQTKEQYVFLHEAVAESLLLGTHGILVDQIQDLYSYLSENDPVTNLSRMYMQFQLIIDSTENYENDGVYANDNEYFDMDMGMQHITSDETSFTRNLGAVFTTDYKGKQSFIIAQIPNSATMEMFWSLVRDKNIKTVVIVTDTTSPNYKQYLSSMSKKETDCSPVSMLEEKTTYHYIERQFQYTGKKVARGTVRLIEYTKWTDSRDVPDDRGSMIALLDHVLECQECCSDKEPILILCTTGHLKSGVICALLNEFYRTENDRGNINIIETVKLLKEKERFAIKSFEQYQYIYDVLLAKLCGEKLYENM